MKKSLEELKAIRSKKLEEINLRKGRNGYRVVVGMATCGIAAGARPVMVKLMEAVESEGLSEVTIAQTGCIGVCRLEPIVEVFDPQGEKTTYVKMNPEKVTEIVEKHLKNGEVVEEYTMTVVDGKVIDPVAKA
ncbi:MAG: (2Fe-2S) ferredoxin domain-containing protein [Eubacterium aggregans]|uniref:NAD(P)-dependent iron-only hydrogenase iron-sulfur protein n=1 Tax=Eubacterium aggregans TaxID=81409 RepID=A0A1H3ZRQ4_9FIRM|nr:(2Fe-2S) ferredoxin domain-containing protein [Eubacterium aggregans]MDD4691105.1 (2Fe-2S) ferredoxin domain-containing protein [Eubacterium aggregans]MEA5073856.1 (2Fe-2S) ferredoxin domain-containing protein [Eubacterium aggregans]SEA26400.1 NAD(P)-dependent iron-only hydrogenase iron-sulfur protein [Eubacterium aggregans]